MTTSHHEISPAQVTPESPGLALTHDVEPLALTNPRLEAYGTGFITDRIPEASLEKAPRYTISEVAKVFFGKTDHWIRWLEQTDKEYAAPDGELPPGVQRPNRPAMVLDGKLIEPRRTGTGARFYCLDTVEQIAHALASNQRISGALLNNVLTVIEAQARIYGYL